MKRASHHILFCNSVHAEPAHLEAEKEDRCRPPSSIALLASWNGEMDEDTLEALTEALRPRPREIS